MKDRGMFGAFRRLLGPQPRKRGSRERRRCPLTVEALEKREVPTVYTWTATAAGTYAWNNPANWGGAGFPNAVDDVANLTSALAGNETINLNVPITVGTLNIGASSGTNAFQVLPNGGSLTFSSSSDSAVLTKTSGGADAIAAQITMSSALTIDNNAASNLLITSAFVNTNNDLTVGGSGNTKFSGVLDFTNVAADGTSGTVTKTDGGTVTFTNNLAFGALDTLSDSNGGGSGSGVGVNGNISTGDLFVNGGTLKVGDIRLNDLNQRAGSFRGVSIAAGAFFASTGSIQIDPRGDINGESIYGPGTLQLDNPISSLNYPSIAEDVGPNGGDGGPYGTVIGAVVDVGGGATQWIVGKTDRNDVSRYTGDLRLDGGLTGSATVQFAGLAQNGAHQQSFALNADDSSFTGTVQIQNCYLALTNNKALTSANSVTFDNRFDNLTGQVSALFLYGHSVTIGSLNDSNAAGTTAFIVNAARDQANAGTNNNNLADPSGLAGGRGAMVYPGQEAEATLTIDQTTPGVFNGIISDGRNDNPDSVNFTNFLTLSLVKTGSATLTLTGNNAYTGATTISQGVLSIATLANGGSANVVDMTSGLEYNPLAGGGMGSPPPSGVRGVGASINAAGKLILDGGTLQYTGAGASSDRLFTVTGNGGSLDASGAGGVNFTNSGSEVASGAVAITVTLTGTGMGANVLSSVLADGTGPTAVLKTGTGTWDLTAANTYTGATHVSAGTLLVDGSVVSPVTVDAGATVGGAGGTLHGATNTINGILAPGNASSATGLLTVNNLTIGAHGALNIDLTGTTAGTGYDQVTATGTAVTLTAGAALNLSSGAGFNPAGGTLFDILVNNTGAAIAGTFHNLPEGTDFAVNGTEYQITYRGGASHHDIVLMRIPPAFEWVDSRWAGLSSGTVVHPDPTNPATTATIGTNAFSTIGGATAVVPSFGDINVLGNYDGMGFGTFHEAVDLTGTYTLVTYDGPVTIDSLAGVSGSVVQLNAGNSLTIGGSTANEFDGLITGPGSLTRAGTGTQILGGVDNYTGGTSITSGVLEPASATAFGVTSNINIGGSGTLRLHGLNVTLGQLSGSGTVEDASSTSATLTIAGGASSSFGGVLQNGSGAGILSLAMTGTGTFGLTGANSSYTGTTTVQSGTLSASTLANGLSKSSLGASSNNPANVILNGGTLLYAGPSASTDRGFTVSASGGAFSVGTAGVTLTVGGSLANGTDGLTVGGAGNTTYTGVFTGTTGTLTKTGTGTVSFTNPLAFGTIDTSTTNGVLTTGNIAVNGGDLQVGNIKLNEGARGAGVREIAIAADAFFTGTGTINLDPGDNTYNTQISGPGTLQLRNSTSSLSTPSIADDDGPNGGDGGPWGSVITAVVDTGVVGGPTQWIIGQTNRNDVIRYAGDLRFDGPLTGAGPLQFVGLNINGHRNMHWVLNADNSAFTGSVSIANCDLELANSNALTVANAVTFDSTNNPNTYNTAALYLWGHNVTIGSLNDTSDPHTTSYIRNGSLQGLTAGGTNSSNNPVTLGVQLGVDANATLTIHQTTNGVFNGKINDGWTDDPEDFGNLNGSQASLPYDTLSLVKTGSATLALNGQNGYTGSTTVSQGVLSVATLADGGTGSSYGVGNSPSGVGASDPGPADLILDGGTLRYTGSGSSSNRQFSVTANGATVDASGTGPVDLTSPFTTPFQGTATLTLTGTNTGGNVLAGSINDGTGPTTVVKTGAGTWDLTGSNSYTGQTTVLQGTLLVDGMLTGIPTAGGVTVSSGATLGGAGGTIAANTTVNGSLNPGNAASVTGQLNLAGLTFGGASSTYVVDLYGTTPGAGYDQVTSSGPIALSGAKLQINVGTGFNPALGTKFDILVDSGTTAPSGAFAGLPQGATVTATNGARFTISYSGGAGNDVVLTYTQAGASSFLVTAPNTTTAGSNFIFTVQALDASSNPTSAFTGTVAFSTTDPKGSVPASVTLTNGFGFFLGTLKTVTGGPWTISAVGGAGTVSGTSAAISVTPGAAAKLVFGAQPASTPTGNTLAPVSVQIEDPYGNVVTSGADSTDAVTLAVASGPSSFTPTSSTTVSAVNGVATFSNLTLPVPGTYTLSAIVPEFFTGLYSSPFTVAPLQVVPGSFVGTPSGFSLQFNTSFLVNSQTPVLYGQGFGASAPVPSVTVTQISDALGNPVNNPVEGSLVLNSANNAITFVATNTAYQVNTGSPVLPDGTYMVDVRSSGTTGFQGLLSGSGYLDGLGSGTPGSGDFTTTFTVHAAGKDAVWVPATADGPGQTLVAPGNNQSGGGFPVYLSDSTGTVSNVLLTLTYNQNLLTLTGVTGANFTLLPSSVPGQANLEYNGPVLPSGAQVPLGFITASVPKGTAANPVPYKAKDLLHLSNVSINAGAVPVVTSDGIHVVAYVGDADGNGAYSSSDAVLITRVGLQTDTGFTAYPLVDPVIVGDTDGSGFIPADAALQINEAGVGFTTSNLPNPPIPAGVVFVPISNNVDPTVSIPSHLQIGPGGTVTVPVNLDDAHPAGSTGLTEAHLALTYNPQLFSVTAADIHLGSLLAAGDGWTLTPTINATTGEIAIALSSSTPVLSSVGGSLVTIDFHTVAALPGSVPSTAISLVSWVNPTGSQVVLTELGDAQGTFTLAPAPTNGFDGRIEGVVLGMDTPVAPVTQPETAAISPSEVESSTTWLARPIAVVESASGSESGDGAPPIISTELPDHGTVHAVPLAESFLVAAAPLLGVAYPVNGMAAGAGTALSSAMTEPFFQALARAAIVAGDTSQATARGNALEFDFFRTPSARSLDNMNWDELANDWSWSSLVQEPAAHAGQPDPQPATVAGSASSASPLAAVDQYFMQDPDEFAPEMGME